jgi:hypothetical protein
MPSGVGITWRRFMIGILADNSVTVLTEEVSFLLQYSGGIT